MSDSVASSSRLHILVRGAVQGVGFRPFVYRLATGLDLRGWVSNSSAGVSIEVEGPEARLREFLLRLEREKPPLSSIQSLESRWLDPVGHAGFEIRPSLASGEKSALVLPDIAACPDCVREVFDPSNRRFQYPFTNCTHCGPRFSILLALPYDRANTSMRRFTMCPACQAEYDDPRDRRFHAQPNACPDCGPHLELWDPSGSPLAVRAGALAGAAAAIRQGRIVAVKGLGGFHLMLDARNEEVVRRLRERKRREEKPFAVMFPSLDQLQAHCAADELEARLLRSPESPVVLLRRVFHKPAASPGRDAFHCVPELFSPGGDAVERVPARFMVPMRVQKGEVPPSQEPAPLTPALSPIAGGEGARRAGEGDSEQLRAAEQDRKAQGASRGPPFVVAASVAPGNPYLGAMLPYTPLHHVLLAELAFPVVATSGNLSDEPICIDEREALVRLAGIADLFLVHDRPIVRQVDDSVARVLLGRELLLRRARGYAPLPVHVGRAAGGGLERKTVLGVGPHLKNTVALGVGPQVFISQHIGDLENEAALGAFERATADLPRLYDAKPSVVAADRHPDYLSTKWASRTGLPVVPVQHHHAHVLACMAENELEPPALGVSWDGTGYGLDGTIWGGEFLRITPGGFERFAHLRTFRLPGGERAVKEPRRAALGLLYEMWGEPAFDRTDLAPVKAFRPDELALLRQALPKGLNAPVTSSMGRLFDAVAGLIGLRQTMRHEGQAAMELEFALDGIATHDAYPLPLLVCAPASQAGGSPAPPTGVAPSQPLVLDWSVLVEALLADWKAGVPAGLISARFHNALAAAIVETARRAGEAAVALTGGCFQNRYLTERAVLELRAGGFKPYWHQRVPPNDGGVALGQVMAARAATVEN